MGKIALSFFFLQIISILDKAEAECKILEVCRKHAITSNTSYKWRAKFGGMTVSEAKRLKALEEEKAKLKAMLAEAMFDDRALRDIVSKKW